MTDWTTSPPMRKGDRFTLPGHFQRRTFWKWLTRQPRMPRVYEIMDDVTARSFVEYRTIEERPRRGRLQ